MLWHPCCMLQLLHALGGGSERGSCVKQGAERQAVANQTQLLAFDRQNHMGASDGMAATIRAAIQEEAEAMLADKRTVSSAVNIRENEGKMKACHSRPHPCCASADGPVMSSAMPTSQPFAAWPSMQVYSTQ